MCGRSNIHQATEVSGVQPRIWAGGRSAALLSVKLSLSSLASRRLCYLLCAWHPLQDSLFTHALLFLTAAPTSLCLLILRRSLYQRT